MPIEMRALYSCDVCGALAEHNHDDPPPGWYHFELHAGFLVYPEKKRKVLAQTHTTAVEYLKTAVSNGSAPAFLAEPGEMRNKTLSILNDQLRTGLLMGAEEKHFETLVVICHECVGARTRRLWDVIADRIAAAQVGAPGIGTADPTRAA